MTILPDGRVMAVGGTDYYTEPGLPVDQEQDNQGDATLPLVGDPSEFGVVELEGLRESRIFDPETDTWSQTGSMEFGRWYPTLVTLPDGDVFVGSGVTKLLKPVYVTHPLDSGANVRQTETYDLDTGEWSRNGPEGDVGAGDRSMPLYPRLHLLPNGDVYYNTAGQVFNPFGQSIDEPLWNIAGAYDPDTETWTDLGIPGSPVALDLEGAGLGNLTSALNLGDPQSAGANLAELLSGIDPAAFPEAFDVEGLMDLLDAGTLEELLDPSSLDPARLQEIAEAVATGDLGLLGGQLGALPEQLTQILGAGFRGSTTSVMLPLQPNEDGSYDTTEFLTAGGILGPSPGTYAAIPFSRIDTVSTADAESPQLSSRTTGSLNRARWYGTGVSLPDRSVMMFSGASADEVVAPGTGVPILEAERFNPVTEEWEPAATQTQMRTYHNTAVLMPDGRVLVGGHAPISTAYLNNTPIPGPFSPTDRDPSFEIYSPTYTFHEDRPVITSAPSRIDHGETFTVQTPDAADIEAVSLVRQPSLTHLVDGDQRTVELPVVSRGDGEITVAAPPDGAVAPLGQYMLFVSTLDGEDLIPSESAPVAVAADLAGDVLDLDLERLAGPERITTSVAVSQDTHDAADTVVLARADEFADALTGTPLAHQADAPILLTDSDELSEATATEIDRLGAGEVIVLGGTEAISDSVVSQLEERSLDVRRIDGANRFATGAAIAEELPESEVAYLAEGEAADPTEGWRDALAAAPLAAIEGAPVLLVNAARLPDETASALDQRGVTELIVAGSEAHVPTDLVDQVADHNPRRVGGDGLDGTAAALADDAVARGLVTGETVHLATAGNWPDSLSAGPSAAAAGSPLLLVDTDQLSDSPATVRWLTDHADGVRSVQVVGGTAAVGDAVLEEIRGLLEGG